VDGSFDETLENIRRAVRAGLKVTTSTVLTRQSCPEIEGVLALGQSLGVDALSFQRFIGAPQPHIQPTPRHAPGGVARQRAVSSNGGHVRFGTPIPQWLSCRTRRGAVWPEWLKPRSIPGGTCGPAITVRGYAAAC